jgi:hypothetical protein
MNLFTTIPRNQIAKELKLMSHVLGVTPKVLDWSIKT